MMKVSRILVVVCFVIIAQGVMSQAFLQNLPKDKKNYSLYDYRQAFDSYWQEYNVVNGYYTNLISKYVIKVI